jgi:uncharacterized membrane protein
MLRDISVIIIFWIWCSLIGAIVIVIGFYSVMWGKAKEKKMGEEAGVRSLESSREKVPLLQNSIEEI